ncbi:MAG: hypothetical protein R3C05_15385 [Pirellulaceae bacterium]
MAMYADAIDWVSLPNTLGMSQHGDDGIVGTKPHAPAEITLTKSTIKKGMFIRPEAVWW